MPASLWQFGGLTWRRLAKRVLSETMDDDIMGRAAQLSYYFLLALFPLLLFLTSLLGYFAQAGTELRGELLRYLGTVVPAQASDLINTTVNEVSKETGGGKLSFGLLATLWAASNGMGAICDALNVAYEVKETRPWWKVRLLAVGLTIGLSVMILSALVLVLFGGRIADLIAAHMMYGRVFTLTWKVLQWPLVLLFVLLAFALIYYVAPDLKARRRWAWITPGSVLAVLLWLLVSFGFRLYLHYFDSYSATYGSLGAVIVLMLWFYFTGAAVLIGGELNSEITYAAERVPKADGQLRGETRPQPDAR
ncbi:MAG TPA: YihY/virulence factor BrkB family protein [Pyrinomonadaceae bacterium]|jgi:membrane protein